MEELQQAIVPECLELAFPVPLCGENPCESHLDLSSWRRSSIVVFRLAERSSKFCPDIDKFHEEFGGTRKAHHSYLKQQVCGYYLSRS